MIYLIYFTLHCFFSPPFTLLCGAMPPTQHKKVTVTNKFCFINYINKLIQTLSIFKNNAAQCKSKSSAQALFNYVSND